MEQRIQKLLTGICSRRTAEAWIAAGRVSVNGQAAVPGQKADPERDIVLLDGKPLPGRENLLYLMLHKPPGYVSTMRDERGRPTVAELVRDCGQRVFPVGRLDYQSEGLLIMTNDGELSFRLTHPAHEVEKEYEVTVTGDLTDVAERLSAVRTLDGGETVRPATARLLRVKNGRAALSVTIREGKKRQIRRMCAQCGLRVTRLRRVREHTLSLGDLPPGKWRRLTPEETAALRNA
ncbi:MAG: rRNA pseudouridine synthase [Oscillospiraceae bacterium]|nr:rRNA pseudouridine synthase [Oscillospiraceae bacterium]